MVGKLIDYNKVIKVLKILKIAEIGARNNFIIALLLNLNVLFTVKIILHYNFRYMGVDYRLDLYKINFPI